MASGLTEIVENVKDAMDENLPGGSRAWTRGLAAGALLTGAVLLAAGRRRAGLAVTVAGTVVVLLEDQKGVRELWDNLPNYIESAHEALNRFEVFVQDLAEQGDKIRKVVREQTR